MRLLPIWFGALLLAGCGSRAPAPTPAAPAARAGVSFARDVLPVFTAGCQPCHSGAADARSKYNLTTHAGVVAEVLPGRPDSSELVVVLEAGRMPPSGRLDPAQLATIREWVARGAKDD